MSSFTHLLDSNKIGLPQRTTPKKDIIHNLQKVG